MKAIAQMQGLIQAPNNNFLLKSKNNTAIKIFTKSCSVKNLFVACCVLQLVVLVYQRIAYVKGLA